jgi:hypothetical protein
MSYYLHGSDPRYLIANNSLSVPYLHGFNPSISIS